MAKAAFYGRFSSNNQREASIDAQQRESEEFAKRNGHELVYYYADKARSGTESHDK